MFRPVVFTINRPHGPSTGRARTGASDPTESRDDNLRRSPLGVEDASGLTACDVTSAVLCTAGSGVSASTARYFVYGLRPFLRFCFVCFVEGLVAVDLSQAAMLLGGRRGSSLPKGSGRRRTVGRRRNERARA